MPSGARKRFFIALFAVVGFTGLKANAQVSTLDTVSNIVTHRCTYGVGHGNVLDTYLSPSCYEGISLALSHSSERLARWGRGRVTTTRRWAGDVSALSVSSDDDKAWDALLTASGGWHYNWHPRADLRLAAGGLVAGELGSTYLLRGGNNPAQARLALRLMLSLIGEHTFRLWGKWMTARVECDIPMVGVMFTPNYGQSYYEIFSLGHYDRNIRATHPFNAPSAMCSATLAVPIGRSVIHFGYVGDVRQSNIAHLKHHAWKHYFVVGYTKRVQLLPNKND